MSNNQSNSLLTQDIDTNQLHIKIQKLIELEFIDNMRSIIIDTKDDYINSFYIRMRYILTDLYGDSAYKNLLFQKEFNQKWTIFKTKIYESVQKDLEKYMKDYKNNDKTKIDKVNTKTKTNIHLKQLPKTPLHLYKKYNISNSLNYSSEIMSSGTGDVKKLSILQNKSLNDLHLKTKFKEVDDKSTDFQDFSYIYSGYIKHCRGEYNLNLPLKHTCGGEFILIKNRSLRSLPYLKSSICKETDYLICVSCNEVYSSKSFLAKCGFCEYFYFSSLHNTKQDYYQITYNSNHCRIYNNDPIKCETCHDEVVIPRENIEKDDFSVIFCLTCGVSIQTPNETQTNCVCCGEDFFSKLKIYNKNELKHVKQSIKNILLYKKSIAKPKELNCCDYSTDEIDFFHSNQCSGLLYNGTIRLKDTDINIIICGECRKITRKEEYFWTCPICNKQVIKANERSRSQEKSYEDLKTEGNYVKKRIIPLKNLNKINIKQNINSVNFNQNSTQPQKPIPNHSKQDFISITSKNSPIISRREDNKQKEKSRIMSNSHVENRLYSIISKRNKYENNKKTICNVTNINNISVCNLSSIIYNNNNQIFNQSPIDNENQSNQSSFLIKESMISPLKFKFDTSKTSTIIDETSYNSNSNSNSNSLYENEDFKSIKPKSLLSMIRNKQKEKETKRLEVNEDTLKNKLKSELVINISNISLQLTASLSKTEFYIKDNIKFFNIEDFRLFEKIGEGSHGTIYSVISKSTGNKYALKKIYASDEKELESYSQEYSTLQKIKHPFILTIHAICLKGFDSGLTNTNILYVLMDLAISDWNKEIKMRKEGNIPFSIQEIVSIMYQTSVAMAFLQSMSVSHRDIKPHNILKFKDNIYKIADFGEAKFFSEKKPTSLSTVRGTELYMSPLLFNGLKNNIQDIVHSPMKSDVFSLGLCFLYSIFLKVEMLYNIRNSKSFHLVKEIVISHANQDVEMKRKEYKWIIDLILDMILFNENSRPDFYMVCEVIEKHLSELRIMVIE